MHGADKGLVLAHRLAVGTVAQAIGEPSGRVGVAPRLEPQRRQRGMHRLFGERCATHGRELAADLPTACLLNGRLNAREASAMRAGVPYAGASESAR